MMKVKMAMKPEDKRSYPLEIETGERHVHFRLCGDKKTWPAVLTVEEARTVAEALYFAAEQMPKADSGDDDR